MVPLTHKSYLLGYRGIRDASLELRKGELAIRRHDRKLYLAVNESSIQTIVDSTFLASFSSSVPRMKRTTTDRLPFLITPILRPAMVLRLGLITDGADVDSALTRLEFSG